MRPRIGAQVLFASDLERTVASYRVLGLPLQIDDHGEDKGALHFACDLDGCHFAVFPADREGKSSGLRESGASFPGFVVESVEEVVEAARTFGARVIQEPSPYPWGLRAVLEDPDGRPVEVYRPPD
jgi:predicted enzyme related to lactoylglutathione lyase